MYIFLIIYLVFLVAFIGFSAFVIYYSFKLSVGPKGKIGLLAYCLLIGIIIIISLILISRCQWSWDISLPQI